MSYYSPHGAEPTLPARKREAARRELERIVTRSGRRRRWRRPWFAAMTGGVVLIGTSAAMTYAHLQAVTNKTDARCYTVASTAGPDHYTTIAAPGEPGSPGRVEARAQRLRRPVASGIPECRGPRNFQAAKQLRQSPGARLSGLHNVQRDGRRVPRPGWHLRQARHGYGVQSVAAPVRAGRRRAGAGPGRKRGFCPAWTRTEPAQRPRARPSAGRCRRPASAR